jgi:hypothetical protein
MARRRRKNPWTHGVLGLGNTRAAAGLADAARMRDAERDRYNYLKDAVAAAKAGASLREIVALTHAAARIRKLTKDEAMRVVFARRLAQEQMRNPRGWTWAHAKAAAARRRVRRPEKTDAEILAAPATQGSIEAAVKAAQANAHLGTETCLRRVREAVLAHARSRRRSNPPRDPRYVGAFTGAGPGPKRSKDYVDGDTAAVVSPYKPGRWEVWMFGMDDPSRGETWNYVGDAPNRADAEAHARKLLAYF